MAWTQAERDALAAAISRGVLSVSLAGETITYYSLKEMRELLAEMDRSLAASTTGQSYRVAATSKGL